MTVVVMNKPANRAVHWSSKPMLKWWTFTYATLLILACTMGCSDARRVNYMKMPVDELFSSPQVRQLVQRAIDGDIEEVRALAQAGADVNALGRGNVTPLIALLFQGKSKEGFQTLLDLGADPNRVMVNGLSVMNVATSLSDPWWIETAIKYGGDVDLLNIGHPFDFKLNTPLFYAISSKNTLVAKALIDHGADIDHVDANGRTPVECAMATRNYELAYYLVERQARLDGRSSVENTDVLQDIRRQNSEFHREFRLQTPGETEWFDKIIALLESRGIDMSPPTPSFKPDFKDPRVDQLVRAAMDGNRAEIRALANAGVDLNAKGRGLMTPLIQMLLQEGSKEGFEALLEYRADPNALMMNGQSPMHICARRSDPWWIETAIRHGGKVDLLNEGHSHGYKDSTPLMYAARAGHTEVARVLVNHGANVNLADRQGRTPLASALTTGNYELAHYLLERGARLDVPAVDEDGDLLQWILRRNTQADRDRRAAKPTESEWFDKLLALLESRGFDMTPPGNHSARSP